MSTPAPALAGRHGLRWLAAAGLAALIAIVVVFLRTDQLWYATLGYGSVFTTTLVTRVALFAAGAVVMGGAVLVNTSIAFRLRPATRMPAPSEILARYRDALELRFRQFVAFIGAFIALCGGLAASGQMLAYQSWRHREPFGVVEPRFGLDVGFFVFSLPWWRFVAGFLLTSLALATFAAAVVHFVTGALRTSSRAPRPVATRARIHLAWGLGLVSLAAAAVLALDRLAYAVGENGAFTGIGFVEDHARISGDLVVAIICVLVAGTFFAMPWLRRWLIPATATALAVVSALVMQLAYPLVLHAFWVQPNALAKQQPYIERHIQATRQAYGVDKVEITDYAARTETTAGQLREDAEALPGIRLVDPALVAPTFEQRQQVRGYYTFPGTLDVDRYRIDGRPTDTVVAVRDLDTNDIGTKDWNNLHTRYTHGFGLVAAYGDRLTDGEPEWLSYNLPPEGKLPQAEPRVYFGEQFSEYSVVGAPPGTPPAELDTPNGTPTTYAGRGGVPMGDGFTRALYAARMADLNLLLSRQVNSESKIIYDRNPRQRVAAVAPWLTVDRDAYPAIVDGRIVWIVDAYTTSNSYPNARRLNWNATVRDEIDPVAEPDREVTYVRNSVKATVDAYDGTVTLYAWDTADPILKTFQKAYPGVVRDRATIPADLLDHLRYPTDLFRLQRQILTSYHVTDPQTWFQHSDDWMIPKDPNNDKLRETPFFLSIKWPGESAPAFSQTASFTARNRDNLVAYLAVNADASQPGYGSLRVLRMSDHSQVDGPSQAFNEMVNNAEVARRIRDLEATTSVKHGNLLTLPIGGGLMYVQPVYTEKKTPDGKYPSMAFVVTRFGQRIGVGDTLQQSLDQLFGGNAGARTQEGVTGPRPATPPTPPTAPGTGPVDTAAAAAAAAQARTAFAEADAALKRGDLAEYQRRTKDAQEAVERVTKALGG